MNPIAAVASVAIAVVAAVEPAPKAPAPATTAAITVVAPGADDLLKKYDAIMGPENFESVTQMTAHRDDDTTRTYKMRVLKNGTEKFRLWFSEPAAVRGQEMLRQGENLWIYLPNLKKPTRLASRESFQGGDFNNADVLRVHYQTDYAAKIVAPGAIPDAWELELKAKTTDAAYHRIRLWIRRADFMPVKGEYYSQSGKMLRMAEFSDVKNYGGFKRPSKIVMKNMLAVKRFSVMTVETMNVKVTPVPARFVLDDLWAVMRGFAFSPAAIILLLGSRAALADAGSGAGAGSDGGTTPDGPTASKDAPPARSPAPPPVIPPVAPDVSPSPDVPEGATGAQATQLETVVNGYLDTRFTGQRIRADRLLPADDVPALANLTEGNFQLKLRGGARALVLADASFFFQRAGFYRGPEHDVAAYRSLAVISEVYGSYSFSDHVNVTLGKKRVVWGPGFLINPMDLLNPPKDPTDPSLQRAGAWLARVEFPTERITVSLVGAAKVLEEYAGVPARLAVYPSYDPRDDGQAHVAGAARLYALVADTDVNVQYVFTNLYNDAFRHKSRVGLSFSRLVGKALEVHMEALGQLGSSRLYANPTCVADLATATACATAGTLIADRTKLDAHTPVVKGIIGGRYTFGDDSMLGVDYALFTDGYSDSEWRAFLQGLALARDARAAGLPLPVGIGPGVATGTDPVGGTPQKFSFEPQRRQYLFVNYVKPRISDDFTLNLTLIASLQDLSGQLSPQVIWQAREWFSLTAQFFVPLPAAFPTDIGGTHHAEYGLAPVDYRGLVSARVFY